MARRYIEYGVSLLSNLDEISGAHIALTDSLLGLLLFARAPFPYFRPNLLVFAFAFF